MLLRKDQVEIARIISANKFPQFTNRDTVGLWAANSWLASKYDGNIHRTLSRRWEQVIRIEECRITGTGMMWVTESGMDCDCVQYSGHMHKCEATLAGLEKLYYEINAWADGPFSLHPVTEEEREEIRLQSRDLAMEAHEDGHPHVVSTVRFDEDGSY